MNAALVGWLVGWFNAKLCIIGQYGDLIKM